MRVLQYSCVMPKSETELAYIVDNMESIDYDEFVSNVNMDSFRMLKHELGYVRGSKPTLKEDWHVRYGKCFLPEENKTAYIMVHSCIEYVFYED